MSMIKEQLCHTSIFSNQTKASTAFSQTFGWILQNSKAMEEKPVMKLSKAFTLTRLEYCSVLLKVGESIVQKCAGKINLLGTTAIS